MLPSGSSEVASDVLLVRILFSFLKSAGGRYNIGQVSLIISASLYGVSGVINVIPMSYSVSNNCYVSN